MISKEREKSFRKIGKGDRKGYGENYFELKKK
jgi:hypothetical protein